LISIFLLLSLHNVQKEFYVLITKSFKYIMLLINKLKKNRRRDERRKDINKFTRKYWDFFHLLRNFSTFALINRILLNSSTWSILKKMFFISIPCHLDDICCKITFVYLIILTLNVVICLAFGENLCVIQITLNVSFPL
jgi:hypothetical protein